MNGKSTTVLMGAGATRGALRGFNQAGSRIVAPLNGDFLSVIKRFVKAQDNKSLSDSLTRLTDFLINNIGLPKSGNDPTMEDIFSYIYASKDFPSVYARDRGRKPKSLREINDFLTLSSRLFAAVETSAAQTDSTNHYRTLVRSLEKNDTLITLNYETVLDCALAQAGWDSRTGYGFTLSGRNCYLGYKNGLAKPSTPSIRLLKLHGSLNWYLKTRKTDDLGILFTKKPKKIRSPESPRTNEIAGYIRQIIPPIYGKFFAHDFWKSLWSQAFKSLTTCDELVVIGCSLVPSDFHLWTFIGRVKTARRAASKPFNRVVVVDPSEKIPQKYKHVLRGCADSFEHISTFEKYVAALETD